MAALAEELIRTGLATPCAYNHLSLHPALCIYLRGQLDPAEHTELTPRWLRAMAEYAGFLDQQHQGQTELVATLTRLELPNLFALLEQIQTIGNPEATIALTTGLRSMRQNTGKPLLVMCLDRIRDAAMEALGTTWTHADLQAQWTRVDQQLASGRLQEALEGSHALLQRAQAVGATAYPEADYDLAMTYWLRAQVLKNAIRSKAALPLLDEAQQGFETIARDNGDKAAKGMVSRCLTERGDCLLYLDRLDQAAAAYEEAIERAEQCGDERTIAVARGQIGSIRRRQGRYAEALAAYEATRAQFTRLGETISVAKCWSLTGVAYQEAGQSESAEHAYQKAIKIKGQLGDLVGQASTLIQLGTLHAGPLDRPEEAVNFHARAADIYAKVNDEFGEGLARSNLGLTLRRLGRLNEARREIQRAITCQAQLDHTAQLWASWGILAKIERDAGNFEAATQAREKAVAAYLEYRRDGGENHTGPGRLVLTVSQALLAGDSATARALLEQAVVDPNIPDWGVPSFRPSRPLSPAAATPASPPIRTCTTPWPPRFCS